MAPCFVMAMLVIPTPAVAEPILTASARLSDSDLIEIASTKTQAHMLAISARPQIGTAVTDILLQRGNQDVVHTLAENSGARFSARGFETLVRHAESDGRLAEKVGPWILEPSATWL